MTLEPIPFDFICVTIDAMFNFDGDYVVDASEQCFNFGCIMAFLT